MISRSTIRTLILLSVFFLSLQSVKAQKGTAVDSADFIEWKYGERLSWKDYTFRSFNRSKSSDMAITSVKISARGYIRRGIPDFKVKVFFVKKDSWTSDSTDTGLLQHEQLHFDIGEVYAQRIREKIQQMRDDGITSPRKYRAAIQNLITVFKSYSGQYDRDTSFGTVVSKQDEWNERIAASLRKINEGDLQ